MFIPWTWNETVGYINSFIPKGRTNGVSSSTLPSNSELNDGQQSSAVSSFGIFNPTFVKSGQSKQAAEEVKNTELAMDQIECNESNAIDIEPMKVNESSEKSFKSIFSSNIEKEKKKVKSKRRIFIRLISV